MSLANRFRFEIEVHCEALIGEAKRFGVSLLASKVGALVGLVMNPELPQDPRRTGFDALTIRLLVVSLEVSSS